MQNMRELKEIAVSDIVIDSADNSRVKPVGVDKLAESIKENGLINPITVIEKDSKYRVVAGFNRAHAVKKLGIERIPAVIDRSNDPKKHLLLQISENLDRNDFTTYETAVALKRLEDSGMSRAEISNRLSKSQSWISNYLGLFDLPEETVELVKNNPEEMQAAHVRFLHAQMKYLDADEINALAEKIKGKTQNELTKLRTQMEEARAAEEGEADATGDEAEETEQEASGEEDEAEEETERRMDVLGEAGGPRVHRSAIQVREAVVMLGRAGASKEGAALAKYQGAIETLQWILGDDEIPLFEGFGKGDVEAD